jgi:hypothetical protein
MASTFAGCDIGLDEQRTNTVQLTLYHYPLSIKYQERKDSPQSLKEITMTLPRKQLVEQQTTNTNNKGRHSLKSPNLQLKKPSVSENKE